MSHSASRSSEILLVARDDSVVTLTFNRPEARNAMTRGMYARLLQVCAEVDADDAVRVLVLRGAGGTAFVSGTDISQFTAFETAEDGLRYERDLDACIERLERVRAPVIAQVEGYAVGAGMRIAAACDIRIATPSARFGAPIARTLGNCLSMAAYASLLDLLGPSRLKELIFTARLLTAEEAHAAGFVHEIVPAAEIAARVHALAAEIAQHAPITLRVTKEAVRRIQAERRSLDGDDLVALTYTSADFKEGVRAFLEKRKPRWGDAPLPPSPARRAGEAPRHSPRLLLVFARGSCPSRARSRPSDSRMRPSRPGRPLTLTLSPSGGEGTTTPPFPTPSHSEAEGGLKVGFCSRVGRANALRTPCEPATSPSGCAPI